MSDRRIDGWLNDEFERCFAGEPPRVDDWGDVLRRALPRKDALPMPVARARAPRRQGRGVTLVVAFALVLVPAAVIAGVAWQRLVVGDPAPGPVRHAIARFQQLPGRVARSLRLDPATARIVATAESTRGPVYLVAGATVPRRVGTGGRSVPGECTLLLYGFPIEALSESVVIARRRFWFDSVSCGGRAPAERVRVQSGGWQLADEHLAVGYGHLARPDETVRVVRADGRHTNVATWHGYFVVVQADDGLAPRLRPVDITVGDAHGNVLGHPFRAEFASPLPSLSPHPLVGTSVVGARVLPGNVWLSTSTRTTLFVRPRVLLVDVENGGSLTIHGAVTVEIRIGDHLVRRTLRGLLPGVARTVRLSLPADLPPATTFEARTLPLRHELTLANNREIWRVGIRR